MKAMHGDSAPSAEGALKEDMRKYSRGELLEVILLQAKEIEALKKQLDEKEAALAERSIALSEAGNIAEASLKLNHIFEDAELAVAQYKTSIQELCKKQEAVSEQLLAEAREKAEGIVASANKEASAIVAQAQIRGDRSKLEAEKYWDELSTRLEALYNEHKGLRELVGRLEDGSAGGSLR